MKAHSSTAWPEITLSAWRDTCEALHLYAQVVGKYRLARTPWVNHSWHATLYVCARGLTTSLVPDDQGIEILFDLRDHVLVAEAADGRRVRFPLEPMTVADFHDRFVSVLREIGATPAFHGKPNEVPDAVPFALDHRARPYDADAVSRFHRALIQADRVFKEFRARFLGKASPVHLFWGAFDLAVTRFSGRLAPPHPGGIIGLPDAITREAYSHEVSSAGFWPGGGAIEDAAFYSYAYPTPSGFADAPVRPDGAAFNAELGEFLLPYDRVRTAADPDAALLAFLESTYEAAARLGRWDRKALERSPASPMRPQPA